MSRAALVVVGALVLLLAPRPAHADCAEPPGYDLTVTDNTVAVCVSFGCDPSNPILRQDEATGDVVSIATTCDASGCFDDACVPPGKYRYGLSSPLTCADVGCGDEIPYFAEATVTTQLSTCTGTVPTPYTATPPWGSGSDVTASLSCPHTGCHCGTVGSDRGKVLALDFLVAAAGLGALIARRRRAPRHRT